jgi:hypothetical protein
VSNHKSRLKRLEGKSGIGSPERTFVAVAQRVIERWGWETPVEDMIPESDEERELLALFEELEGGPPQYQLTPEEQLAEGLPPFGDAAAPGQTDSADVLPLPNGLHELPDGDAEDDADEPDEDEDYY